MQTNRMFFTADTHFGDESIIRYENRPFSTVEEMDSKLIEKWNSIISAEDEIFVLGDFSAYDKHKTAEICKKLNGRKYLVMGNHDTHNELWYYDCGFESVSKYTIIYDNFWILSHEPLYINTNMPYANIFGHVHNNPIYATVSPQSYCVSLERTGYVPIGFTEIKKQIKEQVKCSDIGRS